MPRAARQRKIWYFSLHFALCFRNVYLFGNFMFTYVWDIWKFPNFLNFRAGGGGATAPSAPVATPLLQYKGLMNIGKWRPRKVQKFLVLLSTTLTFYVNRSCEQLRQLKRCFGLTPFFMKITSNSKRCKILLLGTTIIHTTWLNFACFLALWYIFSSCEVSALIALGYCRKRMAFFVFKGPEFNSHVTVSSTVWVD